MSNQEEKEVYEKMLNNPFQSPELISHAQRALGRPPLPPEERRVSITARVSPETKRALEALKTSHGSIGKAIDFLAKTQYPGFSHQRRLK